jgi:hypothetical protein
LHQELGPSDFASCRFRVIPVLKYASQKAYEKLLKQAEAAMASRGGHIAESEKKKVRFHRVAMEAERAHNAAIVQDVMAGRLNHRPLLYGQSVQLQHVVSDTFVTTQHSQVAKKDKKCMRVTMEAGSEDSCVTIRPRFKTKLANTPVLYGEQVTLSSRTDAFLQVRLLARD